MYISSVCAQEQQQQFAADPAGSPQVDVQVGHFAGVNDVKFISNGQWLVSASQEIIIWDVERKTELRALKKHAHWIRAVSVSPDEKIIASAGDDKIVRLWEIETGRQRSFPLEHTDTILALSFSRSGKILASGAKDGTIKLWNVSTGTLITSVNAYETSVTNLSFHPQAEETLVSDGHYGNNGNLGNIKIWKFKDSDLHLAKNIPVKAPAEFSPDGRHLFSGSDLWNAKTWKKANNFIKHPETVKTIKLSRDGNWAAVAGEKIVALWDLKRKIKKWELTYENLVLSLAFSKDGTRLAVGSLGIDILNTRKGKKLFNLKGSSSPAGDVSFSEDAQLLLINYPDFHNWNGIIKAFDANNSKQLYKIEENVGFIQCQTMSLDGLKFATGTDGVGDNNFVTIRNSRTGAVIHRLPGHHNDIHKLAFSRDSNKLASLDEDGRIIIWNVATGKNEEEFVFPQLNEAIYLTFDSENRLFGGYLSSGAVKALEIRNNASAPEIPLLGRDFSFIDFDSFRQQLAGVSGDGSISLLKNEVKNPTDIIPRNGSTITKISFSANGNLLLGTGFEGYVTVWNRESGKELGTVIALGERDWLAVTPDGFFDGTPAAWKQVIWRFNNNTFDYAPVESFFNEFYRPGLLKEIFEGTVPAVPDGGIQNRDRRLPEVAFLQKPPAAPRSTPSATLKTASTSPIAKNEDSSRNTVTLQIKVTEAAASYDSKSKKQRLAGGVKDLRIFRNGSLVKRWTGDVFNSAQHADCRFLVRRRQQRKTSRSAARREAVCTATLPITAGANNFTAYAFNNDNVKSLDSSIQIENKSLQPRPGTLYVFAVGIKDYPVSPLTYAACDASEIAGEISVQQEKLKKQGAGQYKATKIISIFDRLATKNNILQALGALGRKTKQLELPSDLPADLISQLQNTDPLQPEDAVVIFFSGHGMTDGKRFYLLPQNIPARRELGKLNKEEVDEVLGASISDLDLEQALRDITAGQILMILDACYSGQAIESADPRQGPLNTSGLAQLGYEKGMYILTASQSYEAAAERSDLEHGILTYALLEGLQAREANLDGDPENKIIEREWLDYAVQRVDELQSPDGFKKRAEIQACQIEEKNTRPSRPTQAAENQKTSKNLKGNCKGIGGVGGQCEAQEPRVFYRREDPIQSLLITKLR